MGAGPQAGGAGWRWRVAGRTALAVVGGYGFAVALAAAGACLLPRLGVPRVEAAMGATLAGLILLPVAPIVAFAWRRAWTPLVLILGTALVLGAAAWLAGPAP